MTTPPQVIGNKRNQIKETAIVLRDIVKCNQNCRKEVADRLTYEQLTGFTYLYYIYMFLFSKIVRSKKRGDFSGCDAWNRHSSNWSNFIWIDEIFNRDTLKNKDIINKLMLLRGSVDKSVPPSSGTAAKKHCHFESQFKEMLNRLEQLIS
jgi:hypothetical protein